jgi:hypothetical protein
MKMTKKMPVREGIYLHKYGINGSVRKIKVTPFNQMGYKFWATVIDDDTGFPGFPLERKNTHNDYWHGPIFNLDFSKTL